MNAKIKKETLSDQAYNLIKEDILNFKRKPGEKLVIDQICRDFNLSNTPVREAIKGLQQEGFVEQRTNAGFLVKELTHKESKEYSDFIKILIIGAIDQLIYMNEIDNVIPLLQIHLDKQNEYLKDNEAIKFLRESIKFDEVFVRSLKNDFMISRVESLNEIFSFSVFIFQEDYKNKKKSIIDHMNIIEAIKNKDYELLKKMVRTHYIVGSDEKLYK